jgi:hypothetical protein
VPNCRRRDPLAATASEPPSTAASRVIERHVTTHGDDVTTHPTNALWCRVDALSRHRPAMLRHPHEVLHDPDVLLRKSDALLHGPDALLREPDASLDEPDATSRLPDALLRLPGDSSHSGDAFVARTDALSRHDDASLPDSNGLIPPKGAIQQFARTVEGLAKQFDDPFPWRTGNPACPWFIDAAGWTGRIAGGIPQFPSTRYVQGFPQGVWNVEDRQSAGMRREMLAFAQRRAVAWIGTIS